MKGIILTLEQKGELEVQTYDGVQFYNPVLDANNEYFITEEEVNNTTNTNTLWVKDLPIVDIVVKIPPPIG
jgi:hypothetical protein